MAPSRRTACVVGPLAGLAYGILCRLIEHPLNNTGFAFVSLAYAFLLPFAMGFLALRPIPDPTGWEIVFGAWLPWSLAVIFAWLVAWEGAICIVIATPAALLMSSLGGWLGASRLGRSTFGIATVLALPIALSPVESRLSVADEIHAVRSVIDIEASAATVWEQIREVAPIGRDEHGSSVFNRIGFPRPVEAKLFGSGVGAVRHASFERGVLFVETVTDWDPPRRLAFTIHADPGSIPATTLDEHVVVGGRYFDVLDGEYVLEPLGPARTRLHLTSHHRLTTTIAFYAGLWTDAILGSVQERILSVIARRCETGA